jgi:hypothetical protein
MNRMKGLKRRDRNFSMIRFCKKNYGLVFALVFLWGFQFVFFPSHHYHLESIHAHSGELSPHQHQSQPHSHELEAFTHVVNNHVPEPWQNEDHHHSDPFDGNHSEAYEINLHKSTLKPESPFQTVMHGDVQSNFVISEPILVTYVFLDNLSIENSSLPDRPRERSPPSFFI